MKSIVGNGGGAGAISSPVKSSPTIGHGQIGSFPSFEHGGIAMQKIGPVKSQNFQQTEVSDAHVPGAQRAAFENTKILWQNPQNTKKNPTNEFNISLNLPKPGKKINITPQASQNNYQKAESTVMREPSWLQEKVSPKPESPKNEFGVSVSSPKIEQKINKTPLGTRVDHKTSEVVIKKEPSWIEETPKVQTIREFISQEVQKKERIPEKPIEAPKIKEEPRVEIPQSATGSRNETGFSRAVFANKRIEQAESRKKTPPPPLYRPAIEPKLKPISPVISEVKPINKKAKLAENNTSHQVLPKDRRDPARYAQIQKAKQTLQAEYKKEEPFSFWKRVTQKKTKPVIMPVTQITEKTKQALELKGGASQIVASTIVEKQKPFSQPKQEIKSKATPEVVTKTVVEKPLDVKTVPGVTKTTVTEKAGAKPKTESTPKTEPQASEEAKKTHIAHTVTVAENASESTKKLIQAQVTIIEQTVQLMIEAGTSPEEARATGKKLLVESFNKHQIEHHVEINEEEKKEDNDETSEKKSEIELAYFVRDRNAMRERKERAKRVFNAIKHKMGKAFQFVSGRAIASEIARVSVNDPVNSESTQGIKDDNSYVEFVKDIANHAKIADVSALEKIMDASNEKKPGIRMVTNPLSESIMGDYPISVVQNGAVHFESNIEGRRDQVIHTSNWANRDEVVFYRIKQQ